MRFKIKLAWLFWANQVAPSSEQLKYDDLQP